MTLPDNYFSIYVNFLHDIQWGISSYSSANALAIGTESVTKWYGRVWSSDKVIPIKTKGELWEWMGEGCGAQLWPCSSIYCGLPLSWQMLQQSKSVQRNVHASTRMSGVPESNWSPFQIFQMTRRLCEYRKGVLFSIFSRFIFFSSSFYRVFYLIEVILFGQEPTILYSSLLTISSRINNPHPRTHTLQRNWRKINVDNVSISIIIHSQIANEGEASSLQE